jgi:phage terminase large subunit-like protein
LLTLLALSDAEKAIYSEALAAEHAKRFLFYQPHSKQEAFHAAGLIAKERLFLAGNRTGKTYSVAVEVCMHLTGNYGSTWNGYRYTEPVDAWVVGKTAKVVRESLQKQYYLGDQEKGTTGLIHPSLIVSIKKARGTADAVDTVYVRHSSGGISKLVFKTYGEREGNMQGDMVNVIHIDEECRMQIYSECRMRTAQTKPGFHGMMLVSMTPLKGMTDLMSYFLSDRTPQTVQDSRWHIYASWDDNPYLPEEEKQRMRAGMSPQELDARERGIPWIGSGLVYPLPPAAYLCEDLEIPNHWPRVYGIDFGWSNPTAVVFGAHDTNNDIVYLYAEYSVAECTPQQHANNLLSRGIDWIPGVYDPAGRQAQQSNGEKLVSLYKKAGMVKMTKAENDRQLGILTVLQRMRAGQLQIFKSLHKTQAEIQKYAYDDKGVPQKKDDHLMDAMRYLIMSGLKIAVPKSMKDRIYHGRYGTVTTTQSYV